MSSDPETNTPPTDSGDHRHQSSPTDLFSSASLHAGAARSAFTHDVAALNRAKLAEIREVLIGTPSEHGKLKEKGHGVYFEKSETYLHQFHSSPEKKPADHPPTTEKDGEDHSDPEEKKAPDEEKKTPEEHHAGGGFGGGFGGGGFGGGKFHDVAALNRANLAEIGEVLIGTPSEHGKLKEKGYGVYFEKSEAYLHQFHSSPEKKSADHPPATEKATDGEDHSDPEEKKAPDEEKKTPEEHHAGGGFGGGFGGGGFGGGKFGDYTKVAEGFYK